MEEPEHDDGHGLGDGPAGGTREAAKGGQRLVEKYGISPRSRVVVE